jgi:surface antigen
VRRWPGLSFRLRPVFLFPVLLLLGACAGRTVTPESVAPTVASEAPNPEGIHPYQGALMQCVPYAREVSGIDITGDAWSWWDAAEGKYERGHQPRFMAVLVLSRTDRLKLGHVAVVVDVLGPREIRVTHANFGSDPVSRRIVYDSMPAIDVSIANDWSLVRFWNYQAKAWGITYEASGFIYPEKTVTTVTTGPVPTS